MRIDFDGKKASGVSRGIGSGGFRLSIALKTFSCWEFGNGKDYPLIFFFPLLDTRSFPGPLRIQAEGRHIRCTVSPFSFPRYPGSLHRIYEIETSENP